MIETGILILCVAVAVAVAWVPIMMIVGIISAGIFIAAAFTVAAIIDTQYFIRRKCRKLFSKN